MSLIIYIIFHDDLRDYNVFVTDPNKIHNTIKELCVRTETDISTWSFRIVQEGVLFDANMT
jgi:hypothetical protein